MGGSVRLGSGVVLVGCVLLAGCLGPSQPLQAETPAEDAPAEGAAPLPAAGAPEAVDASAAPAPVETALAYQGSTGTFVCAFAAVAGQCLGLAGTEGIHELEAPGTPLRLVANVTWAAATPATGMLRVLLFQQDGEAWYWNDGDPVVEGASPLVVDWDLAPFAGTPLALGVNGFQGAGAGPVFAGGQLPQDFAVEGVVTSLPAPAA